MNAWTLAALIFLAATGARAESLDSFDADPTSTVVFDYASINRYFDGNIGRPAQLDDFIAPRICYIFSTKNTKARTAIFISDNQSWKVVVGAQLALQLDSGRFNRDYARQVLAFSRAVTNSQTTNDFIVNQDFSDDGKLRIRLRKAPSGRLYFIEEAIQSNTGLSARMYNGVCEAKDVFPNAPYPLTF